jgi:hypothetical protein
MHYTLNTLFKPNVDNNYVLRQIVIHLVCDWLTEFLPSKDVAQYRQVSSQADPLATACPNPCSACSSLQMHNP